MGGFYVLWSYASHMKETLQRSTLLSSPGPSFLLSTSLPLSLSSPLVSIPFTPNLPNHAVFHFSVLLSFFENVLFSFTVCFFLSLCPTHTLCFSSRDPHVCFFSYLHVLLVVLSLLPFSFRSLSILKWVFPVHTGISPSRLHFLQLIVRTQTNTGLKRKGKRKCLFPSATFVNVTFHN